DQGDSHGSAERGLYRLVDVDHRSDDRRHSREEGCCRSAFRPWPRGNGLLTKRKQALEPRSQIGARLFLYHGILERHKARVVFTFLSLFFLGVTFIWLRLDRSPPAWDDSYYLTNSLVMYDALTDGGLRGYAR